MQTGASRIKAPQNQRAVFACFSVVQKPQHTSAKVYDDPKRAVVVVKGSEPKSLFVIPENAPMSGVVERLRLQIGHRNEEMPGAAG